MKKILTFILVLAMVAFAGADLQAQAQKKKKKKKKKPPVHKTINVNQIEGMAIAAFRQQCDYKGRVEADFSGIRHGSITYLGGNDVKPVYLGGAFLRIKKGAKLTPSAFSVFCKIGHPDKPKDGPIKHKKSTTKGH